MKKGRKIKFDNDTDRQQSIRDSKTKYMLSKQWKCDICDYESNLASKHMHLKTKKHITNAVLEAIESDDRFNVISPDK